MNFRDYLNEDNQDKSDLKAIKKHKLVKSAAYEMTGFFSGVLKDGRPFQAGRANGPLEMDVFKNEKEMVDGKDAIDFIKISESVLDEALSGEQVAKNIERALDMMIKAKKITEKTKGVSLLRNTVKLSREKY